MEYYLRPREIWARAYAQWIAVRSGDRTLLNQVKKLSASHYSWRVWEEKDFEPVAREIDAMFEKRGWL
jgi:hypothetical protein